MALIGLRRPVSSGFNQGRPTHNRRLAAECCVQLKAISLSFCLGLCPVAAHAEPFSSFWSTLDTDERAIVDQVAAGIYAEERGKRLKDYQRLNSASKIRFRARAVELLGVETRPARVRHKGKET